MMPLKTIEMADIIVQERQGRWNLPLPGYLHTTDIEGVTLAEFKEEQGSKARLLEPEIPQIAAGD